MKRPFFLVKYISVLLISFLLFQNDVLAQTDKVIKGTVKDSKGEALPGVNILLKGGSAGAVTDESGVYQINANEKSILVFSFIGYVTTEVSVKNQTLINVNLETDDQSLADVVVVGYGSQKKVNVIGSVVTVSSKEITASPVSTLSNALAGRLPGAIVQQSGGEPGKDRASILIRGTATLGNNVPLVVIDGILGRDMDALNANDVESISMLKDASAAIYGSRAANGVILITTKRGKEGSPLMVNYNFYQGFLSPTELPKMADAAAYASMIREMQTYDGIDESNLKFSLEDIDKYKSGGFPWTHPNTDWINASFKKYSQTMNHNVSMSGGSKSINYYLSFGTQRDEGIFKNSSTSFNRYNLKATVDAKVNQYLTIGVDLNGTQENRKYPSVDANFNLDGAIKSLPTSPDYYPNGLPGPDIAYGQNPVVTVTDQTGFDDSTNYRLNSMFSANLKIPGIKGLVLSSYYAYDISVGQRKLFQTPWTLYQLDEGAYKAAGNTGVEDGSAFLTGTLKGSPEPFLRNYYNDTKTKTFNAKLDYATSINGVHNISAFVAYENSEFEGKGINAFRRYFISDQLPYLFAGGDAEKDNSEWVSIDSRANYFGRLSYNYKETYLFQFTMRRDGSVRFPKDSRWGNFPGLIAGWRVSNEEFWKRNVRFIDYFKLRASWGQLGNDLVGAFQYLPGYGVTTGYTLGSSRNYSTGLGLALVANPNITWEVANAYNVGFESMMLNNHLTFNADFFYQRRANILVKRNASVPSFTGLELPDENYGVVENRGFELVLGYNNRVNDFTYSLNGNIAFARNKIINYDYPAATVPWQNLTGKAQGSQLVYHAIGIFNDQADIDKTPHVSGAIPGDIIIQDYNNDGEINDDDRIINNKTENPEITFGFNFNLSYKNWNLSGLVQGSGNANRMVLIGLQGMAGNYFAYDAEGRWTPDNIQADKPRAFDRNNAYWRSGFVTDYSYQKASYARMKNLQLSYTIPARIQKLIYLKNAQIYVSGQNLFMFYNGNKLTDPEAGGIRTVLNPALTSPAQGVYSYPIMKIYTVGARISL